MKTMTSSTRQALGRYVLAGAFGVGILVSPIVWSFAEDTQKALPVASESGCKSTGRFAASWVSIRAGELK